MLYKSTFTYLLTFLFSLTIMVPTGLQKCPWEYVYWFRNGLEYLNSSMCE